MRFKPVPEPPADLGTLAAVHRSVPLVPDPEGDCCDRLRRRAGVPDRQTAREWLTFLRALGLATETGRGYERVRTDVEAERLREPFVSRVFGAREALETLDRGRPTTAAAVSRRLRECAPTWERHRERGDPDATWRDRAGDLLEWSVLFGLAERAEPAGGGRGGSEGDRAYLATDAAAALLARTGGKP